MSNQPNGNPGDDMYNSAKETGKKVTRKVTEKGKNAVKQVAKKAGKKLAKKAIKAVAKVAMKVLMKVIALLAPYLGIILGILLVILGAYYVVYEIRGSEQIIVYEKQAKNDTKKDDDKGYDRTNKEIQSGETSAIQTYYKYMSQKSYWQIITDDNELLEQDTGVFDYYNKEKDYYLNSNLLFALDETMHRKKFIYPEQFIKPVNYDPEKLELLPLTDEKGFIKVDSEEYNKDGEKTDKKIKSVADYGIGSIFKYKKDQKTQTVEGVMYKKDVWDAGCNCKTTVDTNEPFSYTVEGFPQEIWLMTKAITFVGEFEFKYEKQKNMQTGLTDNDVAGEAGQAVKKVLIGTGKKMKTVTVEVVRVDPATGIAGVVTEEKQVFDKDVPLYGYRNGGVYEELPVPVDTITTDKGDKYLQDFTYNYRSNVPESVMGKFNLEERGVTSTGMSGINMETGSAKDSSKLATAMQYIGIAEKYGSQFGVDPYLIIAIMAQESGGNPTINYKGLMQIIGKGSRSISAKDANGVKQSFTISYSGRQDPDSSIHWATMYLKYLHDFFDGDPVKATLAYNMGEGTVGSIKKSHPGDWNTDAWMQHIPEANNKILHGNGDNLYLEHVFQYYVGANKPSGVEGGDKEGVVGGIVDAVVNVIKKAYNALVKDYSEETVFLPFKHFAGAKELDYALTLATSMEKYVLFSEVGKQDFELKFWEDGYSANVGDITGGEWVSTESVEGYQSPINVAKPRITSYPGGRIDPVYGGRRYHAGTDIGIPENTPIYATKDGVVYKTHTGETYNNGAGLGNYVMIEHENGVTSWYGHLNKVSIGNGPVKQGQLIGYSGSTGKSTGPHLHFEMKQNKQVLDSSQIILGQTGPLKLAPK